MAQYAWKIHNTIPLKGCQTENITVYSKSIHIYHVLTIFSCLFDFSTSVHLGSSFSFGAEAQAGSDA